MNLFSYDSPSSRFLYFVADIVTLHFLWIVLVLVGLVFSIDIRFRMALGNTMGRVMLVSCSVFLIPFVLLALYIFPVQAKFENNIFNNVKNALLMSIQYFYLHFLEIYSRRTRTGSRCLWKDFFNISYFIALASRNCCGVMPVCFLKV